MDTRKILIAKADKPITPSALCNVKIANTFFTRLVGLLRHKSLNNDEGLLIMPCASIHTLGMRFTIDLVFLSKESKVLGVSHKVPPNRFRVAPKGTYSVLELAQGNVSRTGINLDDTLLFD